MSSKPGGYEGYMGSPFMPLSKETATTYGGTKPGKAPTQKTPAAPNPFKLIEYQGRENRVNEIGPSGSTIYNRDPVTGVWTANRKFSPELEDLYNKQVGLVGQDPNAYNKSVSDSMFQRQKEMLDPVFSEQGRSLEQRLANQGLPMGSEAYTGEMNRFDKARNEAYTAASRDATVAGTQTGMQQRQGEFNQLAALLGGQQVGPTAPIDVMGPFSQQYQGQLNSVMGANQNAAARNAQTTGGAASLASMLAMMFACWVAEEIYRDVGKISRIRRFLTESLKSDGIIGRFSRAYHKRGRKWAEIVRKYRTARVLAHAVFGLIDWRARNA